MNWYLAVEKGNVKETYAFTGGRAGLREKAIFTRPRKMKGVRLNQKRGEGGGIGSKKKKGSKSHRGGMAKTRGASCVGAEGKRSRMGKFPEELRTGMVCHPTGNPSLGGRRAFSRKEAC